MLPPKREKSISKFMSLVLRHNPGAADLELDAEGWVAVDLLVDRLKAKYDIGLAELEYVVENDAKGRYLISDGRIRANQGHSLKVDLKLEPIAPPDVLYHGTVERFMDSIASEGLKPQNRHHVHLSPDIETARSVAGRRSTQNVILRIDARAMAEAGHAFYRSENGVWLTAAVAPEYFERTSAPTAMAGETDS